MKATRLFLLGFLLAALATVATVEPADAQCWTCDTASMLDEDGRWTICWICSGDTSGDAYCATSRCGDCDSFGSCRPTFGALDGRQAAPEMLGAPRLSEAEPDAAILASLADPGRQSQDLTKTRRGCDGGIISRWYSDAVAAAARRATAHLRL